MVTVNGQSQGAAPLEVSGLAAGDYEVRVELRGHEAKVQKVTITAAEPRADLQLALSRTAPTGGTADFLSTPFGAAVVVDGAPLGQTPLLQHRLKPGPPQGRDHQGRPRAVDGDRDRGGGEEGQGGRDARG